MLPHKRLKIMKITHKIILGSMFFISVLRGDSVGDDQLVIAAGAGYKKPVDSIVGVYKLEVLRIYGNMQMVASQAKQSGEVAMIIGDRLFLEKLKRTVTFTEYIPLGRGALVIAFRKGITIAAPEDLLTSTITSIFMPHDKKAIYGVAGSEACAYFGFNSILADKITRVGTVPQVMSYLVAGEADAGFVNLTEAYVNKEKIGGYVTVPDSAYHPIEIVAGVISGFETRPSSRRFLQHLQSDTVKAICRHFGL